MASAPPIAQDWAGASAELVEVTPLDGGCISTTVGLQLADGRKAVCKISAHRVDRSYVNEAHQLRWLASLGLPVPAVYGAKLGSLDDPFSYLLMEFVPGLNLQQARQACTAEQYDNLQSELAGLLATLHDCTSPHYSRVEIMPEPVPVASWPAFFHQIFNPICAEALQSPLLPMKYRKLIGRVHERLDVLLQQDDVPRMVHWDVWSSNILARADERGDWHISALLDPNCKFAHFEAEIAYMNLFQTSTPAFMKAYQQRRKLSDDYHRLRRPVYQLYFLLNHFCLFGEKYLKPLTEAAEKLSVS